MSRLDCSGKSFELAQPTSKVTSAQAEIHKSNEETEEKKTIIHNPRKRLPRCPQPHSGQKTPQSGSVRAEVLYSKDSESEESISVTPRDEEHVGSAAVKTNSRTEEPRHSHTGGTAHAPPSGKPLPPRELNGEEEETEEGDEDVEEEDLKAPVELMMEFLRAVMDRDFPLAHKLCQMIVIYEPENPEAAEFLPLIRKKVMDDQKAEQSSSSDDDDESDDSDNSGSDADSSESSRCSSSSSSAPSDEDHDEETHGNRYKPCPPCHLHH
ncbi:glutamate-rich protein 2 [Genypterus blacodes]|uniref:glutamate-rich protein 2 n=1 Tax=Genypterus blacodes TaxID=154954 RepID=UPI003F76D4B1